MNARTAFARHVLHPVTVVYSEDAETPEGYYEDFVASAVDYLMDVYADDLYAITDLAIDRLADEAAAYLTGDVAKLLEDYEVRAHTAAVWWARARLDRDTSDAFPTVTDQEDRRFLLKEAADFKGFDITPTTLLPAPAAA